jgi:heme/copper-type cytochrome/quinol oxidase subunit 3
MTPGDDIFAATFYTLTGFHGAHVMAGVITLIILLLRSGGGRYNAQNHGAVEYAGLYWHFVDLVWILLFTIVYLI